VSARVGVVGASGYTGGETIRWLLAHASVELAAVVGRKHVGEPLTALHPGLLGLTELRVEAFDAARLAKLDAVLLCTPHGAARELAAALDAAGAPRVIDLSADHRHAAGWQYGMVDWRAEALLNAPRIAVPGCFATAMSLSIAPLVAAGVVAGPVNIAAATGSTGSGVSPSAGTHHPERFVDLRAYKVLKHQHVPEVEAFLGMLGDAPHLRFVPWSAPVDRGIFATSFVPLTGEVDVAAIFADAYASTPSVRLRPETPNLRHVRGTGFCDLAVHREGDCAVVLAAIDNLGKGAAAQAVQCLELSLGLPLGRPTSPLIP